MIVFLAVRQHLYAMQSLVDGSYGPALPPIRSMAYEDALTAASFPAATYVFTDIERLSAWERLLAADLFGSLGAAGCRCLNDPARVLTRYRLLRALHAAAINPFRVWRLEDGPSEPYGSPRGGRLMQWARRLARRAPAGPRFPVFIRNEADHGRPLTGLLSSPAELDQAIRHLEVQRVPIGGLLGIEFCAQPLRPGVWAKFGTFRVGDVLSTDHAVTEDTWCVKHGVEGTATDDIFRWERDHVVRNSYAAALRAPFDIAGIEFGRADHATVDGREVIYEINTNPYLAPLAPQRSPLRDEAAAVARGRLAAALWQIDGGDGAPLTVALSDRAAEHRDRSAVLATPFRP